MRKRDLERCRTLLVEQRERILGNEGRVLSGELDVDPDDFPDEIDTAVAESRLSFTGQIKERERRLLSKIERTLEKIDQGTYGECEGCGDEIGAKRPRGAPGGQSLHRLQRRAGAGRAPTRVNRGRDASSRSADRDRRGAHDPFRQSVESITRRASPGGLVRRSGRALTLGAALWLRGC